MAKINQFAIVFFIAAAAAVSAAPALEIRQNCAALWGQCGGQGWTGPTTCCSGSVCTYGNPYYSQCLQGSGTPVTTTVGPRPSTTTTTTTTRTSPPASSPTSGGGGGGSVSLPNTWKWTSSNQLVGPKTGNGHSTVPYAIKDPSIVFYNGVYHVYASTVSAAGYNLVYLNFTSFDNAGNSPHFFMDQLGNGWPGYKAAPQIFYFAPQRLWYLIWQSPNPTYSTNSNPGPTGWSTPRQMITSQPSNVPASWIDFFNICDDSRCYLFFSNDNGQWFQTNTAKSSFPSGWGGVTKILDSGINRVYFEASMIYKVKNGSGNFKYFAAIESGDPSWNRYFHGFTAPSLAGPWTALSASGDSGHTRPFAGQQNVVWPNAWTKDVSHGELIRTGNDEYLEVDFCNLKLLYQGMKPGSTGDYNALPWRLGVLTSNTTPSGC
ncbi:glycosyl hydrolase family 62 protein [Cladochytrium replicatum]|nr:glycosyl hydrolase family 62 protein [Cladochytrium replicatum]